MKRHPTEQEVSANHICVKGLISRIYKELQQRQAKQLKNGQRTRHLFEDTQMDNKHMERCSTSLVFGKM